MQYADEAVKYVLGQEDLEETGNADKVGKEGGAKATQRPMLV